MAGGDAMTGALSLARRGACPSLDRPMATGDGLLVRLILAAGALSPAQWAALTAAAATHGNGRIEISRRGNVQLRGLAADRMIALATALAAAKIDLAGPPPVEIHPLAGHIPGADADPRPLANALRAGLDAAPWRLNLPAKTSVVIDGGGAWTLADLGADCRLTALDGAAWRLTCGIHDFGPFTAAAAVATVLEILAALAAGHCRARDLPAQTPPLADLPRLAPAPAVKTTDLIGVRGLGDGQAILAAQLPFGGAMAANLARFGRAAAKAGANALHPAPGKTLLVTGLTPASASCLRATAEACDLITAADDRRRWVVTCAGRPACGQAHLDTVEIARHLVANLDLANAFGGPLHISGCAKGCARPPAPAAEIIGTAAGPRIVAAADVTPALRAQLSAAAEGAR